MENYPKELETVFSKKAENRTADDIDRVVSFYQAHTSKLVQRMAEGHSEERKTKAQEIANMAIEEAALNHGPQNKTSFHMRWPYLARKRIRKYLNSQRTPDTEGKNNQSGMQPLTLNGTLDALYRDVDELVRSHLDASAIGEENRLALVLLYGKKPMTVTQVAKAMQKNRQIVSQVEENIHRRIRAHSDFPELKRRWTEDVLPALQNQDGTIGKTRGNVKRKRLERLFKRG